MSGGGGRETYNRMYVCKRTAELERDDHGGTDN